MIIAKIKKIGKQHGKNPGFGDSKEWHTGIFSKKPVVGERFNLIGWSFAEEGISTSPVVKILKHNVFCTKNSIYKLEYLEQPFTYATYKFYDRWGRRMAIFATKTKGNLDIIAIPCNKKDQFCIKEARNLYYKYRQSGTDSNGVKRFIRPGSSQYDFFRWCQSNYGQKVTLGVAGTFLNLELIKYDKVSSANSMYLTYVKPPVKDQHTINLKLRA